MDQAALRARRAAAKRRVIRRRRAGLAGVLAALAALGVVLTSGGAEQPARQVATTAVPAVAVATTTPAKRTRTAPVASRPRAAMPGAHLAPREPVPILMYHVIGELPPTAPNPSLWVSPAELTAHVRALSRAGYHAVTLQRVWDAWHHKGKLPSKPVVLSFDDGYSGHARDALPALAAVGWPGVLNLEVSNLKGMGGTKAVKRLLAAGWELGAHTLTHPDLTTLGASQLREQVRGSRTRLRELFGADVSFFCYPSGRYDDTVIAAVKRAGYRGATTTEAGWATPAGDAFKLPRVRVDGGTPAPALLKRLGDMRPS